MKVLKDRNNLGSIESSSCWVEVSNASVVCEQVTTFKKLSYEVDVSIILEKSVVFHLYDGQRK